MEYQMNFEFSPISNIRTTTGGRTLLSGLNIMNYHEISQLLHFLGLGQILIMDILLLDIHHVILLHTGGKSRHVFGITKLTNRLNGIYGITLSGRHQEVRKGIPTVRKGLDGPSKIPATDD